MGNMLSVNVLSVIVAYLLTLVVVRMAVAGLSGRRRVAAFGSRSWTETEVDLDADDERPRRGSLTLLALIVPVLGILWTGSGTSPAPPWSDMFGESLSDLAYVLCLAMFFPRFDIIGLGSRRAKLWTALGFFVTGSVLLYVPGVTT